MNTMIASLLLGSALTLNPAQDVREATAPRSAIAHYNLEKDIALSGYDPVTYFAEGGGSPKKGVASITLRHQGVLYRFANEKNRDRFLKLPERFEPAYGGWCAYAMAKTGDQVEVDPESYLIENGQLLVFYDGFLNNTRKKWKKAGGEMLGPDADDQWARVSGELAGRSVRNLNLSEGLAIGGYDPVSYRTGSPQKGKPAFALLHARVTYYFATEANRQSFLADPKSFDANYGGWCAWAMAKMQKVEVDPTAFVLEGDVLYLFYNADKRDEWRADKGLKQKANVAWATYLM